MPQLPKGYSPHDANDHYFLGGSGFAGHYVPREHYQKLVDALGEPETYEDLDKIQHQWMIETPSGQAISIYDYKNNRGIAPEDVERWHVGAHDPKEAEHFLKHVLPGVKTHEHDVLGPPPKLRRLSDDERAQMGLTGPGHSFIMEPYTPTPTPKSPTGRKQRRDTGMIQTKGMGDVADKWLRGQQSGGLGKAFTDLKVAQATLLKAAKRYGRAPRNPDQSPIEISNVSLSPKNEYDYVKGNDKPGGKVRVFWWPEKGYNPIEDIQTGARYMRPERHFAHHLPEVIARATHANETGIQEDGEPVLAPKRHGNAYQRRKPGYKPHYYGGKPVNEVREEYKGYSGRPSHSFRHDTQDFRGNAVDPMKAGWSQKAGCACGCSPGHLMHNMYGDHDIHVTYRPRGGEKSA